MPSKYFSQSLPYRRLQKFANGIWDEERKTFYKFKIANSTVPAKRGISYYVNSVSISAYNSGDRPAGHSVIYGVVEGSTLVILGVWVAPTIAASNINMACSNANSNVNVLLDDNAAITCFNNNTFSNFQVVYAAIPSDPAGGPVVVQ